MAETDYYVSALITSIICGLIALIAAIANGRSPLWFLVGFFLNMIGIIIIGIVILYGNRYTPITAVSRTDAELHLSKLEQDANAPKLYNDRGISCSEGQRYSMAIDNFTKAIELDPKYAIPYFNRAQALEQIGKAKDAVADYKKYISLGTDQVLVGKAKLALGLTP